MHPDTPARTSPWTPERDERLRALWLDGKSATEIAWTFGEGISRNAVIGRVHRLKLNELRPRPVAKPKPAGRGNPGVPKVNGIVKRRGQGGAQGLAFKLADAKRQGLSAKDAMPLVLGRGPSLALPSDDAGVDVTSLIGFGARRIGEECAWIPGDPLNGAMCCGKPTVDGTEWCAEHRRQVYSGFPGQRD